MKPTDLPGTRGARLGNPRVNNPGAHFVNTHDAKKNAIPRPEDAPRPDPRHNLPDPAARPVPARDPLGRPWPDATERSRR